MAQGYYTLEEAAGLLGMSVDELKMMARRGDVRSFQDRGTWRFRVQDIQELARQRGLGSEPELALGDALKPAPRTSSVRKPSAVKKSGTHTGNTPPPRAIPMQPRDPSSLHLPLDVDAVDVGPPLPAVDPSNKAGSKSKLSGPRSPAPSTKAPPEPGSDSDVRLVNDHGKTDFGIDVDSDVRLGASPPPAPKSSGKLAGTKSGGTRASRVNPDPVAAAQRRPSEVKPSPPDSGVRLVPLDSDSDVRIVGADQGGVLPAQIPPLKSGTDSEVRLEFDASVPPGEPGALTEEIDLDAELRKHGAAMPPAQPAFPVESPFELSETDFNLPSTGSSLAQPLRPVEDGSSEFELLPDGPSSPIELGSSDLELSPAGTSSSPVEPADADLGPPLQLDSDDFTLSGPADAGISLEQDSEGSDELDFGIKPEAQLPKTHLPKTKMPAAKGQASPKDSSSEFELTAGGVRPPKTKLPSTQAKVKGNESSSEFELSIVPDDPSALSPLDVSSEFELNAEADPGAVLPAPAPAPDSSEFELTLDTDEASSEFELTIDASGEAAAAPDLTSDSEFELQLEDTGLESSSEFELTVDDDLQLVAEEDATPQLHLEEEVIQTDLDQAPLLQESGSDVVPLDGEDTGLDGDFDIEIDTDAESGSAVVVLDEDEMLGADAGVGGKGSGLDDDFDAMAGELGEAVEREPVIIERDVYAAPWPAWPVIVMLPCVVVMFFVGLMGFELVQSLNGYQDTGPITKAISDLVLPK